MNKNHTHQDHIAKGAALVSLGVFMLAVQSALAKGLGATYHPVEMIFYRNVIVLFFLALYFTQTNKWPLLKTQRMPAHIGRALVGTLGVTCGFWGMVLLPLPDATTLGFTGPLFVVLLSYPILKESVGPLRIAAVILGFTGVLFITGPGGGNLPLFGIALILAASFFHALVQIFLRDLGKTENTVTTVFYFMLWGAVATGAALPFVWTGPHWSDAGLILGLGLAGGLQQVIKTKGYALAPTALLSPLSYVSLIWATLFGWLFWNHIPGWQVAAGAAIIIASNLFILWREQKKSQKP